MAVQVVKGEDKQQVRVHDSILLGRDREVGRGGGQRVSLAALHLQAMCVMCARVCMLLCTRVCRVLV